MFFFRPPGCRFGAARSTTSHRASGNPAHAVVAMSLVGAIAPLESDRDPLFFSTA
jgi:hypothetical protein